MMVPDIAATSRFLSVKPPAVLKRTPHNHSQSRASRRSPKVCKGFIPVAKLVIFCECADKARL